VLWRRWACRWPRRLAKSGIDGLNVDLAQLERGLVGVLSRQTPNEALAALVMALKPEISNASLVDTAIGLDSTVFLRLAAHPKSADIVDYLGSKHAAPLILPGQAIQEFWNNQLQAVDSIATNVRKKFEAFQSELKKADPNFLQYAERIEAILEEFNTQHGHVYDEATVRKTVAVLELLQARASVPYASRTTFMDIAAYRKRTRTPPGFKDDGDGDFFIWADFLTGLQLARAKGASFARAILVTRDQKLDWSRAGIAHPILIAEVKALLGVSFEIWSDERLSSEVGKALADEPKN
jgi:PIN like domain